MLVSLVLLILVFRSCEPVVYFCSDQRYADGFFEAFRLNDECDFQQCYLCDSLVEANAPCFPQRADHQPETSVFHATDGADRHADAVKCFSYNNCEGYTTKQRSHDL